MNETIERKKPSGLNEFEGDFTGEEIMQVTRASVGTYKATTRKLNSYFGRLTAFTKVSNYAGALETTTQHIQNEWTGEILYMSQHKCFAARYVKIASISPLEYYEYYHSNFPTRDEYMVGSSVIAKKIFFNEENQREYIARSGELQPLANLQVVLTQAEYDALEVKDENTTYYIIEE